MKATDKIVWNCYVHWTETEIKFNFFFVSAQYQIEEKKTRDPSSFSWNLNWKKMLRLHSYPFNLIKAMGKKPVQTPWTWYILLTDFITGSPASLSDAKRGKVIYVSSIIINKRKYCEADRRNGEFKDSPLVSHHKSMVPM